MVTSSKKKDNSRLDEVQQRRNAYLPEENAAGVIKANSLVPARFTRIDLTYDVSDNVTKAIYYDDNIQEESEVRTIADVSSSLNNTYFILYSARDETKYHVWYNVGAAGTDPAPASSTAIEIAISADDAAAVVALATQQIVNLEDDFDAILEPASSDRLIITNEVGGSSTDTADFDTGFSFSSLSAGDNRIVATLIMEYDVSDNLTTVYKQTEVIDD